MINNNQSNRKYTFLLFMDTSKSLLYNLLYITVLTIEALTIFIHQKLKNVDEKILSSRTSEKQAYVNNDLMANI